MTNTRVTGQQDDVVHWKLKSIWLPSLMALVIVAFILVFAVSGDLPTLAGSPNQWMPFVFAFLGVTLYVLQAAKQRRQRFELRYVPDYFYRAAQAAVYLYVIMALIARGSDYPFGSWPPNVVGLFVGLFIERVEKAMQGLGQRFEDVLAGFLPRTLASKTQREKDRDRMQSELRFEEIKAQSELLAAQIRDPALRDELPRRMAEIEGIIDDGDAQTIRKAVDELTWDFEQVKIGLREEEMTMSELLAHMRRDEE